MREPGDELERAGVERTERSLQRADLILHVADHSEPKPAGFDQHPSVVTEILLLNKSDLPEHPDWNGCDALRISCLTESGLEGLDDLILARIGEDHVRAESAVAINTRHRDCLRRALDSCARARATMEQNLSVEYAAVDLHSALDAITEIIAAESSDAILDSVFAQFCIGK
jgi:tRNA modification GTPase